MIIREEYHFGVKEGDNAILSNSESFFDIPLRGYHRFDCFYETHVVPAYASGDGVGGGDGYCGWRTRYLDRMDGYGDGHDFH